VSVLCQFDCLGQQIAYIGNIILLRVRASCIGGDRPPGQLVSLSFGRRLQAKASEARPRQHLDGGWDREENEEEIKRIGCGGQCWANVRGARTEPQLNELLRWGPGPTVDQKILQCILPNSLLSQSTICRMLQLHSIMSAHTQAMENGLKENKTNASQVVSMS
jgi:hypothetical protein